MKLTGLLVGALIGFSTAIILEIIRHRFVKKRETDIFQKKRSSERQSDIKNFLTSTSEQKVTDSSDRKVTDSSDRKVADSSDRKVAGLPPPAWLKVIAVIEDNSKGGALKNPFRLILPDRYNIDAETEGSGIFYDLENLEYDQIISLHNKKLKVRGTKFLLGKYNVIGRSDECEIVLPFDQRISRKHCMIRYEGEGYFIYDLGSANHTFVNGYRFDEGHAGKISGGEIILIGDTVLRFDVAYLIETTEEQFSETLVLKPEEIKKLQKLIKK